ncbi:MAG TPA: transporter substrate-binding domain-containing protein [Stellaceae bacterium]|jgi:ABC-type amino acid transport substrate-binding protein|nr:transporter substrate-binding domain-containing protein [Stellaceae bacterium]
MGISKRIGWAWSFACVALCMAMGTASAETLQVGISDSAPIMYVDKSSGQATGFAVEVLRGVLKQTGMTADVHLLPFASLLSALDAGKLDMVIMSPSTERRKSADFTQAFTRYGETLVVPDSDKTAYTSIAQLGHKQVGSTASGGWANAAKQAGATLVPFKTVADALAALRDHKLDAVVGNRPSYAYLLKTGNYPGLHMVASYKPTQFNELSFAFRKGDKRLAVVDAALAKYKQGPEIGTLATKWGFER